MSKTVYRSDVVDYDTGQVRKSMTIKRDVISTSKFIQVYIEDIGALIGCTNAEKNLIICCWKLDFVEFNTNELLIAGARRKELSTCSGIKLSSIYNLVNRLKKKNIIVTNETGRIYLNPNLFFFGYEIERTKMLQLRIDYTLKPD